MNLDAKLAAIIAKSNSNSSYKEVVIVEGEKVSSLSAKAKCLTFLTYCQCCYPDKVDKDKKQFVRDLLQHYPKDRPGAEYLHSKVKRGSFKPQYPLIAAEKNVVEVLSDPKEYRVYKYFLGLSATNSDFAGEGGYETLRLIIKFLVEKCFKQVGAESLFLDFFSHNFSSISTLVQELKELIKNVETLPNLRSKLDPRISNGAVYQLDDQSALTYNAIIHYLTDERPPNIICLYGDRYSGKTPFIRSVSQGLGIDFSDRDKCNYHIAKKGIRLPVLTLDCRQRSYIDIVDYVLDFFGIDRGILGYGKSIEDKLRVIEEKARLEPAVYMFTTLDISRDDPASTQISGTGIRRLLRALGLNNPNCRILISNTGPYKTRYESHSELSIIDIKLPLSNLESIKFFFSAGSEIQLAINRELITHYDYRSLEVPGYILSLAVCVINTAGLSNNNSTEFSDVADIIKLVFETLIEYVKNVGPSQQSDPLAAYNKDSNTAATLWDLAKPNLINHNNDLEWVLPLIAATEEGLTLRTLQYFLKELFGAEYSDDRYQNIIIALNDIVACTDDRLVCKIDDNEINTLEIIPDKDIESFKFNNSWAFYREDSKNSNIVAGLTNILPFSVRFAIDPPKSRGLMRAINRIDPVRYRYIYRMISNRARDRASHIKVQMTTTYGDKISDLNRDILSFVTLLASLDPEEIARNECTMTNPALDEMGVFNIPQISKITRSSEASKTHPDVAEGIQGAVNSELNKALELNQTDLTDADRLKFAYFRMFLKDIDRDYRLTMKLDEDKLRLNLVLQFFNGVGWRMRGFISDKKPLPSAVPEYLTAVFSPSEVAKLLTSIVVSAFYAGHEARLFESIRLAKKYQAEVEKTETEENIRLVQLAFVRLNEAQLDAMFLGYLDRYSTQNTWVELKNLIAEYEILYSSLWPNGHAAQCIAVHKVRLKYFVHGFTPELMKEIESILESFGKLSPLESGKTIGLSGRNGRSLIQAVLGNPAFEAGKDFTSSELAKKRLSISKNLLRLNTSRLSQYKGGDRVGVMMDHAIVNAFEGKWNEARHFMKVASDAIRYHSISPGLRASLLLLRAQISYGAYNVQAGAVKKTTDIAQVKLNRHMLTDARRATSNLLRVSKGRLPYYYGAAWILKTHLNSLEGFKIRESEIADYCLAISNLEQLGAHKTLQRKLIDTDEFGIK